MRWGQGDEAGGLAAAVFSTLLQGAHFAVTRSLLGLRASNGHMVRFIFRKEA